MKKIFVILFSFINLVLHSQNVTKHQQFWFSGIYSYKKEKLNIVSEGSYRNDNWFQHTRQILLREMFFYSHPTYDFGVGCVASWQYPYSNIKPVFELRPTFDIKHIISLGEGSLNLRLRWEMRYFKTLNDFSSPLHRGRFQAKLYKTINKNLSFIASNEVMFQNDASSFNFHTNRTYLGLQKKFNKIKLDIGFMFQLIDRRNRNFDADFIGPISISN